MLSVSSSQYGSSNPAHISFFSGSFLSGQSSGAMDITCLMTSPLARGLFQRAISESGACTGPFAALKVPVTSGSEHPAAEESGKQLAKALGVSGARDTLGAFHGGEIRFVFGDDQVWPSGSRDQALRSAMSGYWVHFAATGNPNRRSLVDWPRYGPASDRYLELGDSVRVGSGLRRKQYDLLDDAQEALDALFKR